MLGWTMSPIMCDADAAVKSDPKAAHDQMLPLSVHAAINQPTQLHALLKNGHSPNARDADNDRTPLHWAAARGNLRCVELLLEHGAEIGATDASGCTPAGLAMQTNQRSAHALLLEGMTMRRASMAAAAHQAALAGASTKLTQQTEPLDAGAIQVLC